MASKHMTEMSIWIFWCHLILSVLTNSIPEFHHYTRRPESRLEGIRGIVITSTKAHTLSRCAQLCSQSASCRSFNYKPDSKDCALNNKRLHDFGTFLIPDVTWHYYGEEQADVTEDKWILVFRGESGNQVKTTDVFLGSTASDPTSVNSACFSILRNRTCGTHFLSSRVFAWQLSNIKKVRIDFYKHGMKVMENEFNGQNTDRENWFSKANLMTTQWLDLALATPAIFSLRGFVGSNRGNTSYFLRGGQRNSDKRFYCNFSQANRKFYITTESDKYSCETNYGWMAVIDTQQNYCPLDKISPTPAFVYSMSPAKSKTLLNNGSAQADVMAIFILMA